MTMLPRTAVDDEIDAWIASLPDGPPPRAPRVYTQREIDHRNRMYERRALYHQRRGPDRSHMFMLVYNTGEKRGGVGGRRRVML